MSEIGSSERPLRVAIVGSGPAGFYTAESLLAREDLHVQVDMFERLPMPYGLVRFGVAPDHEKIKNVTRVFEKKVASHAGFRFFGNVDVGKDVSLDDLRRYYHQICFASGAQTDRRMGIPGEDLAGSRTATEFVAWYNGHPDYRDLQFDLSSERVGIVGVGNVAVDVARILCRTVDELRTTDIAEYALDALAESRVREVHMLGRRGPTQAAFTNPEARELGQLEGADIVVREDEVTLDPLSQAHLAANPDRTTEKKVELLQGFAAQTPAGKSRRLHLRFLVSPTELIGTDGRVSAMRLVRNELYEADDGTLRPRATDEVEELPVDLVFRSVGYRGVPIPGLPFHDRWGVVPNDRGRVTDPEGRAPVTGMYVAGWIKRGPSGVIGTNKPDAAETAEMMVEDLGAGRYLPAESPDPAAVAAFVTAAQADVISFPDWLRLNDLETSRGRGLGRPRVKFTSTPDALAALRG